MPVGKYFAQRGAAVDGVVTGPLCQLLGTAYVPLTPIFAVASSRSCLLPFGAWLLLYRTGAKLVGTDNNWPDEKSTGTLKTGHITADIILLVFSSSHLSSFLRSASSFSALLPGHRRISILLAVNGRSQGH